MRGSAVPLRTDADAVLALCATAALAVGTTLALAGAAGDGATLALVGGGLAGAALVALLAAGFLRATLVVALAAPLPALYASGDTRVAAVAPVAAGAVLAWALRRGMDRAPLRAGLLPRRALLALLGAFLLATLFADDVLLSARETLNFLVLAGLLVVCTDELAEHPGLGRALVDLLVAAGGVCGALAVLQMVGTIPSDFPRWGTPFHRADLGFGQPNGLGLFLATVLPLGVYRLSASRGLTRLADAAAVGAIGLGVVATFSRASWVAVVAAVAALALVGRGRLALRIGGALAVGALLVEVGSGGMLSDTFTRTLGDWVVEQRAALFLAAVQMFLAHPVLGVGPGGFADQVEGYAAQVTRLWDYQDTPHNAFVQMAAETGIVGLIAFAAFLGVCFVVLLRQARRPGPTRERGLRLALFCSFVTLGVASFGIWPFAHGTGEVVMLLLALGFSRIRVEDA
ncbi:MAG: O-antigen ligase family protein [Gemmatimonadetes bacterium]|nr:O-antigen ligase family protein [Gemmatimonadota bacterium]